MHVVALAAQKGGSGKTTLAGHIAVQAERAGEGPVAVIDTDPQGSLADWWNERKAPLPQFAQTTVERLGNDIAALRDRGMGLIVIDTPPAITATIGDVISFADLVLIPTRPSPHDLRSVGATVELAETVGTPFVFVLNGAHPLAKITSEAVIALAQHGPLAPSVIHHRTDFAASMIDGRTVMEVSGSGRSAAEIAVLWDYLSNRLNKRFRASTMALGRAAFHGFSTKKFDKLESRGAP